MKRMLHDYMNHCPTGGAKPMARIIEASLQFKFDKLDIRMSNPVDTERNKMQVG